MKTSARGCAAHAPAVLPNCGTAISSRPKKNFWKEPGGAPAVTTAATEGVGRPQRKS
jgi:hypothetical protein